MQRGLIMIWNGSVASIPNGWAWCDGNNGTPNLKAKFIMGAGGAFNPGDTGGSEFHTHDFTADGHQHSIQAGSDIQTGAGASSTTTSVGPSGTTAIADSFPPYYVLAYIMKL